MGCCQFHSITLSYNNVSRFQCYPKLTFFILKKGAGRLDVRPAPSGFYRSVAAAAAAAIAIAAALAAAPTAAMLVGVPCGPAHTAKHDGSDDDRRQIKISSQKLHHNNALLSARFEKFFT